MQELARAFRERGRTVVAERLRDRSRIHFVLIGDGADREKLEADVASRGLDNFHILGLQPRGAMPDWIASIDEPTRSSDGSRVKYLTSIRRDVLSARSRERPTSKKCHASLCGSMLAAIP